MHSSSQTPISPERDQACRLLKDWMQKGSLPYESGEWQHCSGLTREMVWSCIRHKGLLDACITELSHRPPDDDLMPFLWVGLCQLLLLDGIPDHAAVHETLEATKRAGFSSFQIGFINALFRRILREKDAFETWWVKQLPEIRYSHPEPLIKRWQKQFGKAKTLEILQWNQERSHTYARLTLTGRELKSDLGVPTCSEAVESLHPDLSIYRLPRGYSPSELPDFDQGAWYIQDPSTLMAPALLSAKPGERVLDACAAPGGKTAILAEQLGDTTSGLLACDPNPMRCERLKENMDRLKFPGVEIRCTEITGISAEPESLFDAILLDVPCSNTGVYQRRPDAKWHFRKKMLTELIQLQYQILNQALPLLKSGGRLVYSTCSIEAEETTQQIQNWLSQHPECTLISQKLLLPGEQNYDGAFAALIEKK